VNSDADARIAEAVPDAAARIGWAPGDPLALPDSVLRQVGAQYGSPQRNTTVSRRRFRRCRPRCKTP
jgi:hypothetical protein